MTKNKLFVLILLIVIVLQIFIDKYRCYKATQDGYNSRINYEYLKIKMAANIPFAKKIGFSELNSDGRKLAWDMKDGKSYVIACNIMQGIDMGK